MRRIFAYRVYFTVATETYYVVGACNVQAAILRVKRSWRSFAITRKNRRLSVFKVERLCQGAVVRELKIASCEPSRAAGRSIQPCQPLGLLTNETPLEIVRNPHRKKGTGNV